MPTLKRVPRRLFHEVFLVAIVWNVPDSLFVDLAQRINLKSSMLLLQIRVVACFKRRVVDMTDYLVAFGKYGRIFWNLLSLGGGRDGS